MLDDFTEDNSPASSARITSGREFVRDPVYLVVSACIWLFIAGQVFGIAWYWFLPEALNHFGAPPGFKFTNSVAVVDQSWIQRLLNASVGYLVAGILIWALLSLRKVSRNLANRDFFSRNTETLIRRAGFLMIIYVPASTLRGAAISVISSWGKPEGERLLNLTATNWDLISIITGLILLLFARAISHARGQNEELSQIV
jgi:hypothetical protein